MYIGYIKQYLRIFAQCIIYNKGLYNKVYNYVCFFRYTKSLAILMTVLKVN